MGILKTGKIQSHGPDVTLTARITALEDKYVKALWYAEISSGTSGTITPPTNGTIVLDEWGAGVDAVTSTISTGTHPDFISVKTAAGVVVTATLAANGAWTISGTPSAYPIAIVYAYEIKLINFDRTKSLYEEQFTQGLSPSDSPTFLGLTLSGLTASLPIVTDASKALASLAYTGATSPSFRKNLGLETSDSPTFTGLTLGALAGVIKGTAGVLGAVAATTVADFFGGDLAFHALNQAAVAGLTTTDGPTFAHLHLSDLAAITTIAESWVGPSSTTGIYFKGGKVGIGTTAPGMNLVVSQSSNTWLEFSGTGYRVAEFYAAAGIQADKAGVVLGYDTAGAGIVAARTEAAGQPLAFWTYTGSAWGERMRISKDGNIGIGDSAPGEKLDVNGNINATGVLKIDDVQVVSNRVVDATIDNVIEAAFTALYPLASALLNGIRTAQKTHGLMAAA